MSEQFLNGADVIACFEKVGGKTVAEGVATGSLWYASSINSVFDGVLQVLFVHMVAADFPGAGSTEGLAAGKSHCQRQSRAAPGYFRFKAKGR